MTVSNFVYVAVALLNAAMALMLLRYLPRFGRELPWLALLSIYFAARAVRRALSIAHGTVSESRIDLSTDLLLAGVLVGLLFSADRMIRGFAASRDEATYRAQEYERARRDYTQVVRHRIANPLTVILGAAETLQAQLADPATTAALLQAVKDSAVQIQEASLEPQRGGVEEHDLDAIPHVNQ